MSAVTEFAGRDLPVAPGVVTGVRSFNVDTLGRLRGISFDQVWVPGENHAECRSQYRARSQAEYERALDRYKQELQYWQESLGVALRLDGYAQIARSLVGPDRPVKPQPPSPDGEHQMAGCSCGFYGYYDGSDDYRRDATVSAVVEGYGEVLIGTRGFRAGKARIVALCFRTAGSPIRKTPPLQAQWKRVTRNYPDVPTFKRFDEMVAEFPPDRGLEQSPDNDADFWTRP